MKLPSLSLLLALGLGLLFSGCNSVDKTAGISVSVVDLKPVDTSLLETQVAMTLRFTSESVHPFGFSGSSHKLYFNGGYVGQAVSHVPLGLPPLSMTTREMTLVIENGALVKQLLAMQNQAVASYRLDSVLFYMNGGEGETKVKTTSEGTLDLRSLQAGH